MSDFKYWSVGITAAPRREDTLRATIQSINNAGWPRVHVFAEPGFTDPEKPELVRPDIGLEHVRWMQNNKQAGPWKNFRNALKILMNVEPYAARFMIVQDDIEITKGLRLFIDNSGIFNYMFDRKFFGVASLYTAAVNERLLSEIGWSYYQEAYLPKNPCGALAYVFSRDSAAHFLENPVQPEQYACIESQVAKWCSINGLEYWSHRPSFVRHTGEGLSTLDRGNDGVNLQSRQARSFIAEIRTEPFV